MSHQVGGRGWDSTRRWIRKENNAAVHGEDVIPTLEEHLHLLLMDGMRARLVDMLYSTALDT